MPLLYWRLKTLKYTSGYPVNDCNPNTLLFKFFQQKSQAWINGQRKNFVCLQAFDCFNVFWASQVKNCKIWRKSMLLKEKGEGKNDIGLFTWRWKNTQQEDRSQIFKLKISQLVLLLQRSRLCIPMFWELWNCWAQIAFAGFWEWWEVVKRLCISSVAFHWNSTKADINCK